MTGKEPSRFRTWFLKARDSRKTKDFLVFLVFVVIAAVFWLIMALNDDVQSNYDVSLRIEGKPDSVTFITVPPEKIHVSVRDRGVNLLRHRIMGVPEIQVNFKEFSDGSRMRLSHTELNAVVRHLFGGTASISSVTPDSINLVYTLYPGRRIPIDVVYDVTAAPGMVVGAPKLSTTAVDAFSPIKSDTLRILYTDKVTLRNLDKTTTVEVPVQKVPGTRIEPSVINVTFPVESLVKKESDVPVTADNIPRGQDILFFPSKVRVSYYVPMSRYNDDASPIKVQASFNEAVETSSDKVGVKVVSKAPYMSNVEVLIDSVEYTLVRAD